LVSFGQRVVCEPAAMMFIYCFVCMSSAAARLAQQRQSFEKLHRSLTVGSALRRRLADVAADWEGSADSRLAGSMIMRAIAALDAESAYLLAGDKTSGAVQSSAEITESQRILLDLVEADSAAVVRHGRVLRIGDAPPEMSIYAIASMSGRELPSLTDEKLPVFATDCLSTMAPVAEAIKDRAAGVLAVALSFTSPAYLMFFRKEQVEQVTWAGNPSADVLSIGANGLNPRASFDAWKQDIRGLSRSWVIEEVKIATELATVMRGLEAATPTPDTHEPFERSSMPYPVASMSTPAEAVPQRHVIRIGQR
jgi:hypothetical protein